jgi:N-acetylneuraminic acid mutarotase
LNNGGRYSPASDSWVPTAVVGSGPPSPRAAHSAVWTGTETIFWGGSFFNTGGRYFAATDTWAAMSTTNAPASRDSHTAVWTGTEMIVWGGYDLALNPINTGGRYNPAADSWTPTSIAGAPPPSTLHTAVWTGSRMVVWGGRLAGTVSNQGGRYDPATDSWTATSLAGAPAGRFKHTAVWTGTQMVIWGGSDQFNSSGGGVATGGRYDPVGDAWTPTSTVNAPQGRAVHTAVWTGTSMIVWGGACCYDGTTLNTGGRYDAASDTWTATSTAGAPVGRNGPSSVWTGLEMIVWGGNSGVRENTGGRYVPQTDTWSATSLAGAPSPRDLHTATWAGDKMLIFGGDLANGGATDTGASYCACTNVYRDQDGDGYGNPLDTTPSCDGTIPAGYIARAGDCNDGNPGIHPGANDNNCNGVDEDCSGTPDDLWIGGLSHCGLGVCRANGVFECVNGQIVNDCTPGTPTDSFDTSCNNLDDDCDGATDEDFIQWPDLWSGIASGPQTRTNHTTVWSGSEMIVFGGDNGSGTVKAGGEAYAPSSNIWRTLAAGPAKRWRHTAVWTGSRMVIWGGDDNVATLYNAGSRYDPATDTWSATTTSGAPVARTIHSAVWTGSQMIIWGGRDAVNNFNSGSRYDPVANSWSATTTSGAPTARFAHSAVWTGSVMIIWGGTSSAALATGSRYDPSANSWSATASPGGGIAGRYGHVAVWTGTEMIIWGGTDGTSYFGNGSRYNPSSNTWSAMTTTAAPSGRAFASAAWTGTELIVWGGVNGNSGQTPLQDGARYNPATNTWTVITTVGDPSSRGRAGAVWTGSDFIVWGGDPTGPAFSSGGRYTPVTTCGTGGCQRTGHLVCSGGVQSYQCVPQAPTPEVCDGLDNDCNTLVDDGIAPPNGHPVLTLGRFTSPTNTLYSWTAVPGATGYDTIRGILSLLRATSGSYAQSIELCVFNDLTDTTFQDNAAPAPGEAWWFLVRPVNCGGNGSYDDTVARDAGINAAPAACP